MVSILSLYFKIDVWCCNLAGIFFIFLFFVTFLLACIVVKDNQKIELSAPKDSFAFKSAIRGLTDQSHEFTFTHVYKQETLQKDFFDSTMLPFVKDILDGQNGLCFTYGVTNSGKVIIKFKLAFKI